MSDKQTAYRGETFQGQNNEEPYATPAIDPATGLPVQQGQQWQQTPPSYAPQEGHPQQGHSADYSQIAQGDQNGTAYQAQTQNYGYGDQAAETPAYQEQQVYQEPTQQLDYSAQQQNNYGQYNDQQATSYDYAQGQQYQGQQYQGQQGYTQQDANAHAAHEQGAYVDPNAAYAQPGQEAYQQEAYQAGYGEEVNPYLAAHQNATLPFEASQHGQGGQPEQAYGQTYEQQQYYQNQAQVDTGQAPAVYNGTHDALGQPITGQPIAGQQGYTTTPEGYAPGEYQGYEQQAYDQGAAVDYNNPAYAGFGTAQQQQLPQGMAQINDPFAPAPLQQAHNEEFASSGRKSFLVGAMILGSVIIGGGVAFAYKYSGESETGDRAPVILSDGGDAKVAPENPGGKEFENKNKKIFDRLGDPGVVAKAGITAKGEPEGVESLRGEISERAGEQGTVKQEDSAGGPRLVRTYKINRNGERIVDDSGIQAKINDVKDITGVAVDTGKPSRAVKTVRAGAAVKEQAVVEQKVAAIEKARQTVSRDGDFVVQISARRTEQDALAAFSGLQAKYGGVLAGYRPLIQRADLGNKGIFYRLRVGPMKSKDGAVSVCSQLKSKGLPSCFVTDR